MRKPKVIAIVGPTASGKSDLAVELALRFKGEVISADSRQVYRGLDIGSGKISKEEMKSVTHHLLDVTDIKNTYTGADFTKDAKQALKDILTRDKTPIITGGTFFWLDLLRGRKATAPVPPNPKLREELEKLTTEQLFKELEKRDIKRAKNIDKFNRHRIIRSLEIIKSLGKVPEKTKETDTSYDWLIFGIDIDQKTLQQRIQNRLETRLEAGMVEEVKSLLASGTNPDKLIGLGLEYRYVTEYLLNKITYQEMQEMILLKSKQFAKRQYTWLKSDSNIVWKKFPVNVQSIEKEVTEFLE